MQLCRNTEIVDYFFEFDSFAFPSAKEILSERSVLFKRSSFIYNILLAPP